MEKILSGILTLILVLIAIPPVIWVIAVSLLGHARKKLKEDVSKMLIKEQEETNRLFREATEKQKRAQESGDKDSLNEAIKLLQNIQQRKNQSEKERVQSERKNQILSVYESVVIPLVCFILALIIIILAPLDKVINPIILHTPNRNEYLF